MRFNQITLLIISLMGICSCQQQPKEEPIYYEYCDRQAWDTISEGILLAIGKEGYLRWGQSVAYVDLNGDTIIPFGKYAYLGSDTLLHVANVLEYSGDSSHGKWRWLAIDRNQHELYEVVSYDIAPDPVKEGLVRAKRNGKMGFANRYGQIVIPCKYEYVQWFENGVAVVTHEARIAKDKYDDHAHAESDHWFYIDKKGRRVE